ncbi:hypothetical protein [Streptomyces sp. NPDC088196]|uniref:hypothetical protein n=1 Tax=Streptomyces sp. NPDC088196 TaxID=3154868 RepID=UPI00344B4B54
MTGALAHRLKVATPVMQLAAGVLLVFFLPVLLYRESVTTSRRAIRRDLRGTALPVRPLRQMVGFSLNKGETPSAGRKGAGFETFASLTARDGLAGPFM